MKSPQLFIISFLSLTLTKPDPNPLDAINLNINIPYEKPDGIQESKRKEMSDYRDMVFDYGNNGNNNGYIKRRFKGIGYEKAKYTKYGKYERYGRYGRYGKKATTPASTTLPAHTDSQVPTTTPAPTTNPALTSTPAPTTTNTSATSPERVSRLRKETSPARVCRLRKGGPQTITGVIFCNNWFRFYFNGKLVATDPISFGPDQAVKVKFTWDGCSDKTYAIRCEDFSTSSGYEYISSNHPQLGQGSLIAQFSDGTITNSSWSMFTESFAPTNESVARGCSNRSLSLCQTKIDKLSSNWIYPSFKEDRRWTSAKEYTPKEAGWGRKPTWVDGKGCCTSDSPFTRRNLTHNDGCSVNYDDSAPNTGVAVDVIQDECINPRAYFQKLMGPKFLWGNDLQRDNNMLFRFTVKPGK